jgi:hypothetical protein
MIVAGATDPVFGRAQPERAGAVSPAAGRSISKREVTRA